MSRHAPSEYRKSQISMGKSLGPFHDILCWSDGISSKPTKSPLPVWYSSTSVLSALGSLKYSPHALPCPYFEKSLKVHPLNLSNQFVIHSSCFFTLDPGVDLCLELWTWFWIFFISQGLPYRDHQFCFPFAPYVEPQLPVLQAEKSYSFLLN